MKAVQEMCSIIMLSGHGNIVYYALQLNWMTNVTYKISFPIVVWDMAHVSENSYWSGNNVRYLFYKGWI